MQLEDWLDDLCVRFLINLTNETLSSIPRICFQVEEAQWYYEDFIRPLDPNLPSMSLRSFCLRIFAHCPLLSAFSQENHMRAFEDFLMYKSRIPVRGAIMLNEAMDAAVLVKGWKKGANWSFPRGKINKDEDDLTCAMREVYEETGYDLEAAGLVPENREVKYIEINMREQQMRLYVFRGVPLDTPFETRTRKEISKIQWWRLSELPAFRKRTQQQEPEAAISANRFYMVAPFLVPLKKWVVEQKKKDNKRAADNQYLSAGLSHDEVFTEDDPGAESNTQGRTQGSTPLPELNTFEGATAALSRMLKIQPSTQGIQPEAISSQSPTMKNSGQALLALLHGKSQPSNVQSQAHSILPTPQNPTSTRELSISGTFHQHPSQPPPTASLPPPSFHMHLPPNAFSHPQTSYQSGSSVTLPQIYAQRPQAVSHLYQPQPLPPQVQRTVFAGGSTPGAVQPGQHPGVPHPEAQAADRPPQLQFPGASTFQGSEVMQEAPSKLTSHSLALLNAFKGQGQSQTNGQSVNPTDLHLRRHPEASGDSSRPQPQELPAALPLTLSTDQRLNFTSKLAAAEGKATANQSHRATLLEMFKSPTTPNATHSITAAATSLPVTSLPSAVELSAVEPVSGRMGPTGAPFGSEKDGLSIDAPHPGVPELNPETTHPFRAATILQRSPNVNSAVTATGESTYGLRANGRHAGSGKQRKSREALEKPFQPQILKRPNPNIKSELPAAVPTQSMKPEVSMLPTTPILDRRVTQPSEQKQSLLSLFGKLSGPAKASFDPPCTDELVTLPRANPGPSALMVDGVESSSIRDQAGLLPKPQSSISSADKGFLLSYLDAVAKGN